MKFTPRQYQTDATGFLIDRLIIRDEAGAGLFLDPGFGKTAITLSALLTLREFGCTQTLVIAPKQVIYSTWPAEIAKWSQFQHLTTSIIHGNPRKRLTRLTNERICI